MVVGLALRGLGKALLKNKKVGSEAKKFLERRRVFSGAAKKIGKEDPKHSYNVNFQRGQIKAEKEIKKLKKND